MGECCECLYPSEHNLEVCSSCADYKDTTISSVVSQRDLLAADLKALRDAAAALIAALPECDACNEKATRYDETIKYCGENHAFLMARPQYTISEALRALQAVLLKDGEERKASGTAK